MSHPIRVSMSALTPEQVERLATVVCVWWESDLEVTAPELPTHLLPSDTTPCDSCRLEAQGLAPVVAALIAEAVDQARAEERERIAPDPRIVVQSYVVTPTGYDAMVHSDKDMWCLTVTDGHAWGWSIRRGVGMSTPMAMNRKGEWIVESRGSGRNKPRRWPLDEALSIALAHVDSLRINGHTAQEASDSVAARIARSQP